MDEQCIPATADELVAMLYRFASQRVAAPLKRLRLQPATMGGELERLWGIEHGHIDRRSVLSNHVYGYLPGIGRWSYQKAEAGASDCIAFQSLPQGLVEADYLAIAEYSALLAEKQARDEQTESQFITIVQTAFLPAWNRYSQLMETVAERKSWQASYLPSEVVEVYMVLALALAEVSYHAIRCFTHMGSIEQWESWVQLLQESSIDVNLALLVCHLLYGRRAKGVVSGEDERMLLSRQLEFPYRYDAELRRWIYAADVAYPEFTDTLAAWHAHSCPEGGGLACMCDWGYLCRGCYNDRLVEGHELLQVEKRGGRCMRCWTAESPLGIAPLLLEV